LTHLRTLIHIPIVHSDEDMGSVSDDLRQAYIREKGVTIWEKSRLAIKDFWTDIDQTISKLECDFSRLRLYQDGLPVCGFEVKIVQDLAKSPAGSTNYRILAQLMDLGATLEGTEDLALLLKERIIIKQEKGDNTLSQDQASAQNRLLLEARDRFIAARIDSTLKSDETGLLFLGALHDIGPKLPDTIKIVSLDAFAKS